MTDNERLELEMKLLSNYSIRNHAAAMVFKYEGDAFYRNIYDNINTNIREIRNFYGEK